MEFMLSFVIDTLRAGNRMAVGVGISFRRDAKSPTFRRCRRNRGGNFPCHKALKTQETRKFVGLAMARFFYCSGKIEMIASLMLGFETDAHRPITRVEIVAENVTQHTGIIQCRNEIADVYPRASQPGSPCARWQATPSMKAGVSVRQTPTARGQRGWKGQPGGGSIGLGGSPATGVRGRPLIERSGTASSSIRV